MALEDELASSAAAIDDAIHEHEAARMRKLMFGMGWVSLLVGAVRYFCKNWPEMKAVLEKVVAYLREHDQDELAKVVEAIIGFLGTVAKVCPFIPLSAAD
jgi:hypothetical protein